ncbi:coxsackievirus and adenovirus receptor isoform X2 [Sphaerodactylus townsendi]|uniref:coxsackievirus and adenovirus receptor isoform X2 n=1 Tax=Sphaerodactylus townsendi TaxID=933632 RepID=UPI00202691C7|nr:coxsackievirus and adenovirus receptor isoform X2 [Sphaerodactylus townsendi]
MESSLPLLRLLWILLVFRADLSEGVTITSSGQTMITRAEGEKVTLPCTFTFGPQDTGSLDIEWVLLEPNHEQTVIMYSGDRIYDKYKMDGRVEFVNPNPASGDGTIDILNLKATDTGTYQCKVKKPPSVETQRIQLTVLVKPMNTKCYVEGTQEIGTDLTLKCKSEEGSPIITYSWKKITGTGELPATTTPHTETGDFLVKNASQIYSGIYTCTASNKIGSDECSLELNVTPPVNRAGRIAGAIIGTLLGLLLLAFFIFCCLKKQREKKYEKEVHHDIREDVPPPKSRASTARSYIGSNRSSLGSMSPSNMDGYAKTQYNKVPSEEFEHAPVQTTNFQPPKYDIGNRMGDITVV